MKIAVIGFGWLGKPLGLKLQKLGHKVVGTTTSPEKAELLSRENLHALKWNSREDDFQMKLLFEDVDIVVLNFPPGWQTDLTSYGESIRKLVREFSIETKFIFISSTSVYPEFSQEFKEEDVDLVFRSKENNIAYAEWILFNELSLNRFSIIRMAGLIGGDRHPAKFFAGKKDLPNGGYPVNLIFRDDAINLIITCIENQIWGEIINGCASIHPSKSFYYTFACEKLGFEKPSFVDETRGKLISNFKSKEILGFEYKMDNPIDYWKVNL